MGESHQHHDTHQLLHHHPPTHSARPPAHSARLGGLRGAGEIVEVQGGHIVRSTGRKDRHSKVFTAKGPRDRRVRLSAHTAIQFYDVQDRLGCDRPSKAVDWLIKNAKAAIDELAELPPWHPTATASSSKALIPSSEQESPETAADTAGESGERPLPAASDSVSTYGFRTSGILPPSLESDAIVDTIKSFFPMSATTGSSSSPAIGFQSYPPDLLSRTSSHGQDLRLSLHSFQDPILLHHHAPSSTHPHRNHPTSSPSEQALFSVGSSTALNLDPSSISWSEQNQRMAAWNAVSEAGISGGGGGCGGYIFTMPPPPSQATSLHPVLGQSSFQTQRGPLQSSISPYVRAWTDALAAADHQAHAPAMHQIGSSSTSSMGFAAGSFSGFHIPARIQGEEEQNGMTAKPSSASRR